MDTKAGRGSGRRLTGVAAFVIIVAVFGVLAWRGITSRAGTMATLERDTADMSVPTVAVVSPKAGAPQEAIVLPGAMQAYVEAPIYARTSGYLSKRHVEMGATVKAGQVLAEIDAPELAQQLQQARADLTTAEANARLAQITADRYRTLVKTDSVSQQDADNAVGTLEARRAAVESATFNVQRLEQLHAFTRIISPIGGVITARNTDVGALIDPGASGGAARELFHVAATDRLRVFVNVPQVYSRSVRRGMDAGITLAELPGQRFAGTLVRTAGAIEPASRTLLAEIEVDNRDGLLMPGAFAQVHLTLDRPASSLVVPVNTLMFRGDGVKVAAVRHGRTVALLTVTIGRDFGTDAEVLTGLTETDSLIVSPPDSIADGQDVRVAAAAKASGRGAAK